MMFIELYDEARRWRRDHRRKLSRGKKRHKRVAQRLRNCGPGHRCRTEACRVCMRLFRIWWSGEGIKILLRRTEWTRCSIITQGLLIPYGQLSGFDLPAAVKRIRKRLERSKLHDRIVLGGLDLSLNLENNVTVGWQFHLYLIVQGKDDLELEQAIKDAFPPEPTALKPYDFASVSDPLEAITYTYKSVVKRRSGYKNSQGEHKTVPLPLKGPDLRELLPFLAKYKAGARLILFGVRRDGKRLRRTHRKDRHRPATENKNTAAA